MKWHKADGIFNTCLGELTAWHHDVWALSGFV